MFTPVPAGTRVAETLRSACATAAPAKVAAKANAMNLAFNMDVLLMMLLTGSVLTLAPLL